jgi:hypothetical protein
MARRPTAAQRRLEVLLATLEPQMAAAFRDAISRAASAVDVRALVAALESGDIERAVALLRINQAVLFPLADAVRASYVAGGVAVASSLPGGLSARFGFDGRAVRAEAWVQRAAGTLIEGIQSDTLAMARTVIRDGLERGAGPRSLASQIVGTRQAGGVRSGGFMGLTDQQASYTVRARAELVDLDAGYFRRERRDKRYDRMVARAIRDGKPLSAAEVDKITQAYRSRLLQLRGETIARTETLNALRAGRHEGFEQLVESGGVARDAVQVVWSATLDARTRDIHVAMDGEAIPLGGSFTSPSGSRLAFPGDTSLGAGGADTINCRCYATYRVDYLRRG